MSHTVRRRLKSLSAKLIARVLRKLLRSRRFVGFLRFTRRMPRLPPFIGPRWVVGRADVLEVLDRNRDFGVPYLPAMERLGAPFLLGLRDGQEYQDQLAALQQAFMMNDPAKMQEDLAEIRRCSLREAELCLSAAADGRIDVIAGLTDPVVARTIERYLGVGPVESDTLVAAREVFEEVFINGMKDPEVTTRATVAARRLRRRLRDAIADRRAALVRDEAAQDDVVTRLLRAEREPGARRLEPEVLVNNVFGLVVAWSASVPRTMGFAFDRLLDEPESLVRAHDAAQQRDWARVGDELFEALRFQPSAPAIERVCTRESRLAGRRIKRGTPILAVLSSAMMDGRAVDGRAADRHAIEAPGEFRAGRRPEDYLHFGYEQHLCLGRFVSRVQLEAIATALLARERVRRAEPLEFRGPYPRELMVTFGRQGA